MDSFNQSQAADLLAGYPRETVDKFLRVCELSDYVQNSVLQQPEVVSDLKLNSDLVRAYEPGELALKLSRKLTHTLSPKEFDAVLRRARRREMVRIIFRDFSRDADLIETTHDLSDLADACIDCALKFHHAIGVQKYGEPRSPNGKPQQITVLALGKLGARELNLSSDIDLVFLYDEQGDAISASGKRTSNQEYFLRISRQLISTLQTVTVDGFGFRVDMRLRPYGESSALILHRAAMEKYFVEQGRDWERYAFIKARAVAGDVALGEDFLVWLRPFVFRKHLDYGAIESLREMKRLINRQVELDELQQDLKLGPGGIREIEFIAQAHQLIFGGKNPDLQERSLLKALAVIRSERHLSHESVDALSSAYIFLRNSEHAIQGEADRQTQALPTNARSRQRLAQVMGFDDWSLYLAALDIHRAAVSENFRVLMAANLDELESLIEGNVFWNSVWREPASSQSLELFSRAGFQEAVEAAAQLVAFRMRVDDLQEIARERVNKLLPVLLQLIARQANPDLTLGRVLPILEAILRRSTYLAFLLENADALKRAVDLCGMSPWVAAQLKEFPILLYELTGRSSEEVEFNKVELAEQLRTMLILLDEHDLEAHMDTLRQFKNGAVLRVAMFELLDLLSVMRASDALTAIAEVILQATVEIAQRQLNAKFGLPMSRDGAGEQAGFAIIAYGKLGGVELAYGSDLDLVFLTNTDIHGNTSGEKSINNNVYYSRLAQRVVHMLTVLTRFGILYEVDMRLRPAGNKGQIVSTIGAYRRYLESDAWTWEHQALVRSRFVAGDPELLEQFTKIRSEILAAPRDVETLTNEVIEMREKMRSHLASGSPDLLDDTNELLLDFDLKHDVGAIVDIEFMVQYAVLAWGHEYPALTRWTDKIRILDDLGDLGLFESSDVEVLQRAYLAYRSAVHYQWLGGDLVSYHQLQEFRQTVVLIWQKYMTTR